MTQHAPVCRKKARLSRPVVEELSCIFEWSLSQGHASSAHDEAPAALAHAYVHVHDPYPAVGPDVVAPNGFLGSSEDTSLFPLYAHHAIVHEW